MIETNFFNYYFASIIKTYINFTNLDNNNFKINLVFTLILRNN